MADPQVKQKLADQGLTVAGDTPEHFRGYIGAETKKWAKVIKDAGLGSDEVKRHGAALAQMLHQLLAPGAAAT